VAVAAVRDFLSAHALPERVLMVCFSAADEDAYRRAATEARGGG
jgi:O-acetyl-ADP-ribose deacetylase (regulator of RNase III)